MKAETTTHDHIFGQDQKQPGEGRTLLVVIVTAIMMVVEIAAGIVYGSMALLADGLHMGSHTVALGISVLAYIVSRKLAGDPRLSFGIGKLNSLAGFTSAVLLMGFSLLMIFESIERYFNPTAIAFNEALVVAVVGLLVNGGSALLLMTTPHDHGHDHGHHHHHDGHDHNLRAAYLHVVADALTSFLAIGALLAAKHFGADWLDPTMGIVGGLLVAKWSYGLIREASSVLLDAQADTETVNKIKANIEESGSDRITDLHLWCIGHGIYALEMQIVSHNPLSADQYRAKLTGSHTIVHSNIEVVAD